MKFEKYYTIAPVVIKKPLRTQALQACLCELSGASVHAFEQGVPVRHGWPPMTLGSVHLSLDTESARFALSGSLNLLDEHGEHHDCNIGAVTYLPMRSALGELLMLLSTCGFAENLCGLIRPLMELGPDGYPGEHFSVRMLRNFDLVSAFSSLKRFRTDAQRTGDLDAYSGRSQRARLATFIAAPKHAQSSTAWLSADENRASRYIQDAMGNLNVRLKGVPGLVA